jgi:dTDP-glucose pyrophosphorylase
MGCGVTELSLVMPMAGRGSRFAREGVAEPKPLVMLGDRPFFWWAAESVRRAAPVGEMVFVVLREHVDQFAIDRRIHDFYPQARILTLPEVTSGAAETAALGLRELRSEGPVAINDSDHAFRCPQLAASAAALAGGMDAALLCFRSASPAYSYARLDADGAVAGTVEKQAVSDYAIAGCYLFSSPGRFLDSYEAYRLDCPYDELFVSGLYNHLAAAGSPIGMMVAERHLSFGTPEELARIDPNAVASELGWPPT